MICFEMGKTEKDVKTKKNIFFPFSAFFWIWQRIKFQLNKFHIEPVPVK